MRCNWSQSVWVVSHLESSKMCYCFIMQHTDSLQFVYVPLTNAEIEPSSACNGFIPQLADSLLFVWVPPDCCWGSTFQHFYPLHPTSLRFNAVCLSSRDNCWDSTFKYVPASSHNFNIRCSVLWSLLIVVDIVLSDSHSGFVPQLTNAVNFSFSTL
jgi:hypothetical protein